MRFQSEQEAQELGKLQQEKWLRESADRLEQHAHLYPPREAERMLAEAKRRRASAEKIEHAR